MKTNQINSNAELELGRLHGQIGLFAAKHCSLSDNLPTDETFKRMGEYIDFLKGRLHRAERSELAALEKLEELA